MILNRFRSPRLSPLGQMRACSNLLHLLRDAVHEEAVLRRNNLRVPRELCLEVLTELDLVARQIDPDLGRELMAAHDRFADTTTTLGGGRVPNPMIGANLQLALALTSQVIEALSMTLMARHPDQMRLGERILADLAA